MRNARSTFPLSLACGLGLMLFQGCNTSEGEEDGEKCPGDTSSLIVRLSAPAGVSPAVLITGPGGYSVTLTASDTLSGLAAGSYTVASKRFKVAGSVVGKAYYGKISDPSLVLTACKADTIAVEYLQEPGSERIYAVARNTSKIHAYASAKVAATGAPEPDVSLSAPGIPNSLAFDPRGNLWVSHTGGVSMFAMEDLGDADAEAKVNLAGSHVLGAGVPGPIALAFAADSSLWIALGADKKVIRLAKDQLTASGSPVPAVVLSGPDLVGLKSLAFDAEGNLWVGGVTITLSGDGLVRFDKARLAASYSGSADVRIVHRIPARTYRGGADLAFDEEGDLLIACEVSGFLLTLPRDKQGASSDSLAPAIAVNTVPAASMRALALDGSGGVWTTAPNGFMKADPASLGMGGIMAAGVLVTAGSSLEDVVLNPSPEALPLND